MRRGHSSARPSSKLSYRILYNNNTEIWLWYHARNADMTRLLLPFNRHGTTISFISISYLSADVRPLGLYLCTFRSHHVAPHSNVVNELQLLPDLGRVGCYLGQKRMWHGWTWETRGAICKIHTCAYTTRRNMIRCNNTAVYYITSHPIKMHVTNTHVKRCTVIMHVINSALHFGNRSRVFRAFMYTTLQQHQHEQHQQHLNLHGIRMGEDIEKQPLLEKVDSKAAFIPSNRGGWFQTLWWCPFLARAKAFIMWQ